MANLLVTGGAGFIGVNFVRYWQRENPNDTIVVLDALTYAGNASSLEGLTNIDLVHGDIRDYELVRKLLLERAIDTLVNFAAETHVDRSIHGPDAFIDTNILGTHALLKAAKNVWLEHGTGKLHRFHHVSTDEVFGSLGPNDPPFTENTQYQPNSPYSASKAASDHLVRAYHHTFGLQVTTSNCSNNYGPYQFPEKLIPLFVLNALRGMPLPIYGDGQNVRDWLHVEDHCRGIELILKKGRVGETYNIGGGEELPNLTVIDRICETIDFAFRGDTTLLQRYPNAPAATGRTTSCLKMYVEDRKGHDRRYAIDETKTRDELEYAPSFGFDEGIALTVQWFLDNEHWWQGVISGEYRSWLAKNYANRDAISARG